MRKFQRKYAKNITAGSVKPLNKDFLSEVTKDKFKVYSSRKLQLCEFLEIGNSGVVLNHLSRNLSRSDKADQINKSRRQIETDAGSKAGFLEITNFLNEFDLKNTGRRLT